MMTKEVVAVGFDYGGGWLAGTVTASNKTVILTLAEEEGEGRSSNSCYYFCCAAPRLLPLPPCDIRLLLVSSTIGDRCKGSVKGGEASTPPRTVSMGEGREVSALVEVVAGPAKVTTSTSASSGSTATAATAFGSSADVLLLFKIFVFTVATISLSEEPTLDPFLPLPLLLLLLLLL